ncbi:MAG: hypothetical protein M1813_000618 [Trichoglossum hirsutum]|jgi:hypothetical protein|nr:MAG: hypothetical protein M1813_000618 [Trichoglossum hirsutum]
MAIKVGLGAICSAVLLLVSPNSVLATPTPEVVPRAVSKYYALGDSFASGLAAGSPYADPSGSGSGSGAKCGRFDKAYGVQLNGNDKVKASSFNFLACSGSTAQDVQNSQSNMVSADADIVTVSAGGNNVGFGNIVNACVYRFSGPASGDCAKALQDAAALINDDTKLWNPVWNNINAILARVPGRANFRVYVVGYIKFWNAKTDQCDKVSWEYWNIPGSTPQNMTKEIRGKMNDLVDAVNAKLNSAVQSANQKDNRVVFVNPDPAFDGHRFCEDGVVEPEPAGSPRPNTWFFQLNTPVGSAAPATIEATGDALIYQKALLQGVGGSPGQGSNAATVSPLYKDLAITISGSTVPLSVAKIFHPTTPGHTAIMNAIAAQIS